MPSVLHEVLRELFAKRPGSVAPFLARRLGLPSSELVAIDSELTDPRLKQLLPDAVLACPNGERPRVIVIIEVHLTIAEVKRRVWPQYVAAAFGRWGCRVILVVVTPSRVVEAWARRAIVLGPGAAMTPRVLGPSAIPLLGADEVRRAPVLGMLSTLAHMDEPGCAELALGTLEALATSGNDADGRLSDILTAALSIAVRERMEDLMRTSNYEFQSDFLKKYIAMGQASALLTVLQSRGFIPSAADRDRIENEPYGSRLDAWIARAATATSIADIFTDD